MARHRPHRLKVRAYMIEGAICAAVTAQRRGYHVRSAATGYSLPGMFGRDRLNGPERSVVERLLRTLFDDYTRLRPNVHGNRAQDYVNPLYCGALGRLERFVSSGGDTEELLK